MSAIGLMDQRLLKLLSHLPPCSICKQHFASSTLGTPKILPLSLEGKHLTVVGGDLGQLLLTSHHFAAIPQFPLCLCPQIHPLQREAFQVSRVRQRLLPVQDSRCPQDAALTGEGAQNLQDQMLNEPPAGPDPGPRRLLLQRDRSRKATSGLPAGGAPDLPGPQPGPRGAAACRTPEPRPPGAATPQPGRLPQDAAELLAKKAALTWRKGNYILKIYI